MHLYRGCFPRPDSLVLEGVRVQLPDDHLRLVFLHCEGLLEVVEEVGEFGEARARRILGPVAERPLPQFPASFLQLKPDALEIVIAPVPCSNPPKYSIRFREAHTEAHTSRTKLRTVNRMRPRREM